MDTFTGSSTHFLNRIYERLRKQSYRRRIAIQWPSSMTSSRERSREIHAAYVQGVHDALKEAEQLILKSI